MSMCLGAWDAIMIKMKIQIYQTVRTQDTVSFVNVQKTLNVYHRFLHKLNDI